MVYAAIFFAVCLLVFTYSLCRTSYIADENAGVQEWQIFEEEEE